MFGKECAYRKSGAGRKANLRTMLRVSMLDQEKGRRRRVESRGSGRHTGIECKKVAGRLPAATRNAVVEQTCRPMSRLFPQNKSYTTQRAIDDECLVCSGEVNNRCEGRRSNDRQGQANAEGDAGSAITVVCTDHGQSVPLTPGRFKPNS